MRRCLERLLLQSMMDLSMQAANHYRLCTFRWVDAPLGPDACMDQHGLGGAPRRTASGIMTAECRSPSGALSGVEGSR